MKRSKLIRASGIVLSLTASALAGCGSYSTANSHRQGASTTLSGAIVPEIGVSDPGSTNTGGTGGTETTTTPTQTGVPPYQYEVHGVGYTAQTFTVQARRIVKVKFTPGQQDRNIEGGGASPQYAGLGVFITVGSLTQATPLVYNGFNGFPTESHTIDFSNQFPDACEVSDTACRNTVTITVKNPNYDYWRLNFGYYYPAWTHVSDNHPWHATVSVQTEDTDGL